MDTQLPETQLTSDEVENDEDDIQELLPDLWVEKKSSLIYECKFFDTFVLVRPATPNLYLAIKKLSHNAFMDCFEEFCGDRDAVRDFIRNAPPEFIIE